jgi:hypothetical protein
MDFLLKGLYSVFTTAANMSGEVIEDDAEDQQQQQQEDMIIEDDDNEESGPPKKKTYKKKAKNGGKTATAKVASKNGLEKAKKERKPRVTGNPYTPRTVRVSSAKPVPINLQNKGTKRVARTKYATFSVKGSTLTVTVQKGRGTRNYEVTLVPINQLADSIKDQMKAANVLTLDATRLAVHFPDLYWNAAYALEKSLPRIDAALQEAGIPTGQRREK